ncbi:biotin transporter BioY [Comamonadaceae bacterium PP-2]
MPLFALSRRSGDVITPLRTLATVVAGAGLLTLAAKVQLPFWPVPMTLHTLAVMALALGLAPRLAVAAFMAYLAAGACGLPVFSGSPERGIGWVYLMGPTGGYLLGYLVASGLVGRLAASDSSGIRRLLAMLAGLLPVYVLGAAWLVRFVPADQVLALGVTPFLLGDLAKVLVLAAGWPVLSRVAAGLRSLRS